MSKEGSKHKSKFRIKPRGGLAELHFNRLDPGTKCPRTSPKLLRPFERLPQPLHLYIFSFLSAPDLIFSAQLVSRLWQQLANAPILWQWLEQSGLELHWRVKYLKCLVERRSKGKVFQGILRSCGAPVTLRKVHLDVTNAGFDDGVPTSLLREISYLSELAHPNIVAIVGAEVSGKTLCICTESVEYNLKDFMRNFGTAEAYEMPRHCVQLLVQQLFSALSALHSRSFMHRNLKPDNVLVTPEGGLKITDFALSRLATYPHAMYTPEDPKERDRSGRESRRLWYRAPELLFRKELYAFETDIWAAGCLLAELALGHPLFNGGNEIEQLFKIFRFTGVPKEEYPLQVHSFPDWGKVVYRDVLADPCSAEFSAFVSELRPVREFTFSALSRIAGVIGAEGLDLLEKCLEVDPQKRITAEAALSHPFLNIAERTCCAPPLSQLSSYLQQLHYLEQSNCVQRDYMSSQTTITPTMRGVLVDWLIDVSVHFEVADGTLHLAVGLMDRVLEKTYVDRGKLQLVGVTCMKIAEVLNERSKEYYRQENSIEYAYITADEYSSAEVVEMEKQILTLLQFRVLTPTVLSFLSPYRLALRIDNETLRIALYVADLLLLCYQSLSFRPSLLASAVIHLACCKTGRFPQLSAQDVRPVHSREEFLSAVHHTRGVWLDARSNSNFTRYESVNLKFAELAPGSLWPPSDCPVASWLY